jgi:hypothetical protein
MNATKVALLGVPYDASSSFPGTAPRGRRVIREALWSEAGTLDRETDRSEGSSAR